MIVSRAFRLLDSAQRMAVADALVETAATATTVHALKRGTCRAYALGEASAFEAVIVEVDWLLDEPSGFGSSPAKLWELVRGIDGWECILVHPSLAHGLGDLIEIETGRSIRYYEDIGHTLTNAVVSFSHPSVRQLTVADRDQVRSEQGDLWSSDFLESNILFQESVVAGAIIDGHVVARANAESWTGRYAEIGVYTAEEWRGYGLGTAVASLVCARIQEKGQIPVWCTGEDNWASLRIAQKLGFTESHRGCYVIPQ